jgi:hypothetical protein
MNQAADCGDLVAKNKIARRANPVAIGWPGAIGLRVT